MKYMQVIVHTKGGEVKSAADQATERLYEDMKLLVEEIPDRKTFSFNTDEGWAMIPCSQILYVEIVLS